MLSLAFFVSLQQNVTNMALNLNKNLKLYYSIGEVAQMFELNESTLRYWEQEFPSLRPKVSGPAKVRQYQEKDIEQISVIHNLVKVRGFKIAAAKNPKFKAGKALKDAVNVPKKKAAKKTAAKKPAAKKTAKKAAK